MLATFIVVWRESLEAALVVAILLAYLARIGQRDKFRYIFAGVGLALVACLGFARAAEFLSTLFQGAGEQIFEASVMLVAVAVVTVMVAWMHRQARNLRDSLEGQVALYVERGQVLSLAVLAAIAVFREGAEMVLFLWGIVISAQASAAGLFGAGLAGLGASTAMAWGLFKGATRLDLRRFFKITSIALILIAAGMLAQAANHLIGAGLLPPIVGQVWNSSWLLDERGPIGSAAAALFGYRSRPSLLELSLYVAYCASVAGLLRYRSATRAAA